MPPDALELELAGVDVGHTYISGTDFLTRSISW